MFVVYPVINTNPALGPIKGNSQAVSVYDRKLGNNRTVITTPEEAEEFVDSRNSAIKKANNNGLGITALTTALGAAAGSAYTYCKNIKLNKLIDKLNPEIKEFAANTGNKGIMLKHNFLDLKKLSPYGSLSETFSNTKNIFEKVKLTKGMGELAAISAVFGMLGGLMAACNMVSKADNKVTQEFIDNNK